MARVRASQTPRKPWGKKPPFCVKLAKPMACPEPRPVISANPTAMKARMATTLIIANQYSNSPKLPTCMEFTTTRPVETRTTQVQPGTLGNQNAKYHRGDFRSDRDDLH